MNDASTWMPCLSERAQAFDERVAGEVEALVDVLQAFRRHRFDADQRAADARVAHRIEKRGIFRRFHRDLREEHHVVGQLREARHQLEPLRAERFQLVQARWIEPARAPV